MLCVLELVCWCRCRVPLQGAAVRVLFALWSLVAARCRCKSAVCALELGCWCRWRACFCQSAVLLVWTLGAGAVGGAAASAAVRVRCCWCGPWVLVPLEGPLQVLLSEWAAAGVDLGCWCRWRGRCKCCCQSAECCVRFEACMLVPLQGAAAGCHCRVPLHGAAVRVPGAAGVELGCCRCKRFAARCLWQCGWIRRIKKGECLVAAQKYLLLSPKRVWILKVKR